MKAAAPLSTNKMNQYITHEKKCTGIFQVDFNLQKKQKLKMVACNPAEFLRQRPKTLEFGHNSFPFAKFLFQPLLGSNTRSLVSSFDVQQILTTCSGTNWYYNFGPFAIVRSLLVWVMLLPKLL